MVHSGVLLIGYLELINNNNHSETYRTFAHGIDARTRARQYNTSVARGGGGATAPK